MNNTLLIVFVKNATVGKVKTRLAKTVGNTNALYVYKALLRLTENVARSVNADKHVYFSETIETETWNGFKKHIQHGTDLGQRMQNAFNVAFNQGYNRVVLIGSDLPDLEANDVETAFNTLLTHKTVFGPAVDGGYYLIGLSSQLPCVFNNKPWSQPSLLKETLQELQTNTISYKLLRYLNDIDTFEDLIASSFYKSNTNLQEKLNHPNDKIY